MDIVNEENECFCIIAYHFDEIQSSDQLNPKFDGQAQADYRTSHLFACINEKTNIFDNKCE